MPRIPQLRWNAARGQWIANIDGKRHYLGPNKAKASKAFHRLMSAERTRRPTAGSLQELADKFLGWTKSNRAEGTYEWYVRHLGAVLSDLPDDLEPDELTPELLTGVLDRTGWSDTTKNGAVRAIVRVYSWARLQRILTIPSPIEHMERPQATRREVTLTDEDMIAILGSCNSDFATLLTLAWATGARPQELRIVEARHWHGDLQAIVFPAAEGKGKRPRTIVVQGIAAEVIERLAAERPTGPLLRNTRGEPWTRNAIAQTFARLETKIGKRIYLYALRHTFATDGLKRGVDAVTLSTLMGHADTAMVARVYSHLAGDLEHLREKQKRITG